MLTDRHLSVLAFILLVLLWGSAFSVIKIGLDYTPPVLFAGLRTLLAGLAMTAIALIWGGKPNLRHNWPMLFLLALFNVALFIGSQTFAILYLPSGSAAILVYLQPIIVGFLAWLMLGESLSVSKIVGLFLGFYGIAVVSAGSLSGTLPPVGVAFGITSALFWALGTVYFKWAQARVSTHWAVAIPFLLGGGALTVLGLALESWLEISWTGTFMASLMYSSLVTSALAWMLWLGLVRAGEASRVSAYVFVVPLISVVIGVVFLDEPLEASLLIGGALVVSGVYLANRRPTQQQRL